MASMIMGAWFLANFVGNFLSGYLGTFYGTMARPQFFGMLAAIAVGAGLVLYALNRPLARVAARHDRPVAAGR
jgi:POT family proton-dependent oligopeptide transporter